MRPKTFIPFATILLLILLLVSGAGLTVGLASLFSFGPERDLLGSFRVALRLPSEKIGLPTEPYVPIRGESARGDGSAASIPGSWSNFRGDRFDATYHEPVKLKRSFGPDGPPKLWGLPLGEGFAGPAVRNGRVYLLDYDMENFRDALRCLSLEDGREIWRYSYPIRIKKNHGMSRTIPAVTDRYCVSLGPKCHLLCVDATTGEEKWFLDLVHDYGTTEPEWYAGQCPLIVQRNDVEIAIVAPAGPEVLLMALDCETGKELWRTPNPFGWTMTHVSVVPMELDGRSTYVYCGKGGVVGVDADDGRILWSTTDWRIEIATCPSPVVLPENRIFCCGGYLSGAVMLQISADPGKEGGYKSTTLYRLKDAIFGSEQQTPIFFNDHLFGIRQRDKEFVCLSLDGKVVWHSGSKGRFGSGPYLLVQSEANEGMFLILDDDGTLTACQATTEGYRPLFQSEVLEDHGCWAPMALVAGRLLLRDQIYMACLDLRDLP